MLGGLVAQAAATNFATVSLFNQSSGAEVLVVRGFNATGFSPTLTRGNHQGALGAHVGVEQTFVGGEGVRPGLVYYVDAAAVDTKLVPYSASLVVTSDYTSLPQAVVLPGWSFVIQATTAGATVPNFTFFWEAIGIDELDYLDW
jgi:hypothetical protein